MNSARCRWADGATLFKDFKSGSSSLIKYGWYSVMTISSNNIKISIGQAWGQNDDITVVTVRRNA